MTAKQIGILQWQILSLLLSLCLEENKTWEEDTVTTAATPIEIT
jgi:hypothetical protein